MISKKIPILGINQDDTFALVDTKEYLNALNLRFTTSESGKVGQLSTIEGNVIKNTTIDVSGSNVTFVLPAGTNSTIGAYEDTPNKRMFFFNENSAGDHGIYCYDSVADKIYTVLLSSQVDGGLGFSSLIHSVSMIGNLLYWTDGVNPQRRINVEAGIKTNHPTYTTTFGAYGTLFLGTITAGSSYTNGTYTNVSLTGGTGSGAKATIVVSGNAVTSVTITYGGSGYTVGDSLTTANTNIGGTGSGFSVLVSAVKIKQSIINLIRNQPAYPLTTEKQYDSTYAGNNIAKEAFQFAYRFVYRDGEVSTFSPLSSLMNYNLDSDNFNYIRINVPVSQKIEQDVERVEIAVKFVVGGQYNIVKTWDRSNNNQAIENHNNGNATALQYSFYNDNTGIAVDSASAYKPFDSIPNLSEALEIAKNRLFLGNNTIGYSTPSTTSLTVSVSTYSATLTGVWFILTVSGVDIYLLDITGIGDTWSGYYAPGTYPATTYNYNSSDFRGAGISDVLTYYGYTNQDVQGSNFPGVTATITGSYPSPTSLTNSKVFKSDASYRLGVVFYDYAGRKCGVVTSESLKKTTVDRGYNVDNYTTAINWGLSNDAALDQIPDWAHYYSVVMTKCLRTGFFIQMRATDVKYIKKDFATGEYQTPTASYTEDVFGIAIKIDSLYKYGMGYTYNDGDVLKLYGSDGLKKSLKVKDTYSDYIIVDPINLGTIVSYLFEIYTPYSESATEIYYEKGATYAINNPGTVNRTYSTLLGSFSGDVIMLSRTVSTLTFLAEAMSPNAINWSKWNTDIGRPNIVSKGKTTEREVSICYSDPIILGTEINGLSTFEATSQYTLPYEMSSIQKLQLVSKVGAEGTVMLAVGEQETASIYLGEAQIFDNTGNSFLATTSGVIGNVNILRGSYGTINPESVFRWKGNVVWFDANKGAWVRYDSNGLFPISQNKMSKYFRKVGQDVLAYIADPTEFDLSNPGVDFRVLGGIDPYHEEYLSSIPRMTIHPANEVLQDMELQVNTYAFATLPPTIELFPNTLTFSYSNNGPSSAKSCYYVGSRLEEDGTITVSGSTDFEISPTGVAGTFTSGTLSFPYIGKEATGTFYVRFKSGRAAGTYTSTRVVSGGGASANLYLQGTKNAAASFNIDPASMSFSYVFGAGPSASQPATYSGTGLTSGGTFTLSGTSNFEVSLSSSSGFTNSISIPYAGVSISGTFYIRLKAGLAVASYSAQNVTMTNGTSSDSVSCTGNVTTPATPTLSVDKSSLSFTYVEDAGPSASQAVVYNGSLLADPGTITISAPSNFEISSDNVTFGSSISNAYTGSSPTGTFYVRMKAGLAVGSYGPQTITLSGGGASTTVSCSGTVTSATVTPLLTVTPSTLSGMTYVYGNGPSQQLKTFTIAGENLTPTSGNVTITPPTNYEISITGSDSGFSSSALTLAYTSSGTFASNTVWVRLKKGLAIGTYNGETITVSGGGATSKTVTCNGSVTNVIGYYSLIQFTATSVYVLDITDIADDYSGYYLGGGYPSQTYNYVSADFMGAGISNVAAYYGYTTEDIVSVTVYDNLPVTITGSYPINP